MNSRSNPKARTMKLSIFIFLLSCAACITTSASAQTFCDMVPAATVKTTLGISQSLVAKPSSSGCNYREAAPGPPTLIVSSGDASGMTGMLFNQRIVALSPKGQVLTGVGEAAYYDEEDNQQFAKFPGVTYTRQSIAFRAKGKIVTLIVMTSGTGLPKEALQSLATLAISKPIDTLVDPNDNN